jgi:hypothetical protein
METGDRQRATERAREGARIDKCRATEVTVAVYVLNRMLDLSVRLRTFRVIRVG